LCLIVHFPGLRWFLGTLTKSVSSNSLIVWAEKKKNCLHLWVLLKAP
jgi:hypothetical protein